MERKWHCCRQFVQGNKLLFLTLFGVTLGCVAGLLLRPMKLPADVVLLLSYPGELFMRMLKLLILPLIISSLIVGTSTIHSSLSSKITGRTLGYFAATSFFNACLGVLLAVVMRPGDTKVYVEEEVMKRTANRVNILDSILDLGRNIIPDNILQATFQQTYTSYEPTTIILNNTTTLNSSSQYQRMLKYRSGTNTLGIVFFCLVFGSVLGKLEDRGKVVTEFFSVIFEVTMRILTSAMWLTPIAVASLIATKIVEVPNISLATSQLALFILTVLVGVLIYQLIVLQLIYFAILKRNPFAFYRQLITPMMTAFATASTAAALPITFDCMENKLKIDPRITRFVLAIGCNINMDGTALFLAVATLFIAQLNKMELGLGEYATVCIAATAASMSSASVPSAALVLLLIVLSVIDAPLEDVGLLFTVDWLVDRIRTTNNMLGDCYTAAVIEYISKEELKEPKEPETPEVLSQSPSFSTVLVK